MVVNMDTFNHKLTKTDKPTQQKTKQHNCELPTVPTMNFIGMWSSFFKFQLSDRGGNNTTVKI